MAEAAAHHEQVENLMAAEFLMPLIKFCKLKCIQHTANRINDTANQQPEKCILSLIFD